MKSKDREFRAKFGQNLLVYLERNGVNLRKIDYKHDKAPYRKGGGKMFFSKNKFYYIEGTFKIGGVEVVIREKLTGRREYWVNISMSGKIVGKEMHYCHKSAEVKRRISQYILGKDDWKKG